LPARERLQAVSSHLVLFPHNQQERPDASLLIDLSGAIHASQRIAIDYHAANNKSTRRQVEPYGMTGWQGHWYLIGYCCLRQDYRVFRLDRIQEIKILSETFEKAKDFDYGRFMQEKYQDDGVQIEVEFQADLATVQQKIPTAYGTLTATPTGVLFQKIYPDVTSMARYLMAVDIPFIIHHPPELRDALRQLGEKMLRLAN
jgi:predicted DNA-binding transcriptional regulator YafY